MRPWFILGLSAVTLTFSGCSESGSPNGKTGIEVGNVARDIIDEDLDGVEFKLSDYRGKVVFLDFWGDW